MIDLILDDLRHGLRRRAAVRRARAAAAGTMTAAALLAVAISGLPPGGAASLAASAGTGADATILLRGCDDSSRLACHDPLARQGS